MIVAVGEFIDAGLIAGDAVGVAFIAGAAAVGTFNSDGLDESFIVVCVVGAVCTVGIGAGGELNVGMGADFCTGVAIEAGGCASVCLI